MDLLQMQVLPSSLLNSCFTVIQNVTPTPTESDIPVPPAPNITQPSVMPQPSCGGSLIGDSGRFHSPGWPTSYPINIDCEWTITLSNRNRAIGFTFNRMYGIEGQPPCARDYVDILNGHETDSPSLGRFCSTTAPVPLTSSIGQARVVFHAGPQHPNSSRGFRITYRAVIRLQGDFRCSSYTYVASGIPFGPPAFPEPITANNPISNKCTWLTYDFMGNIQLRIFYFDIPESNGCSQNSLKVYNSFSPSPTTLSKTLCGRLSEYVFVSGYSMTVVLDIGNRTGYRGFHAVFETVN